MKKQMGKSNPVLRIIATMKLAKALDCSYEEADKKINGMSRHNVKGGSTNARKGN